MSYGHPPVDGWTEPSSNERRRLLAGMRTVAMVGVSANPARPSNFVATYLLGTDYDVFFVNPMADEILGRPCVPTLADLPVVPDCVDVFRKLDDVPTVADEAVAVGARMLWTQFGLWSPEA
ncbi:MAG: CoA-binding protein, partial [Acidimicrobiales bacterium]|nr:CoA-binding protein [Acidimicrobiales bacterium]